MIKIIEGSFPAQIAVYKAKSMFNRKASIELKAARRDFRRYDIRQAFERVDIVTDHRKRPTVKFTLRDQSIIIAKIDKKILADIQVLVALGPEPSSDTTDKLDHALLYKTSKRKFGNWQKDVKVLAIIGFAVTIGVMMSNGGSHRTGGSSGQRASSDSQAQAEVTVFCQNLVKQSLKAPKSADFPLVSDVKVGPDEQTYTVISYVDAENGFGATLRSHYVCKLEYNGGGVDGWTIRDFTVLPQ